ncbi:MAG TPA: outer membrane beta-barrel protein [Verrucomicrobiae bacterium]|nr:outer membrane beta-barrel protein [Verrucomicrobiae bacterium]
MRQDLLHVGLVAGALCVCSGTQGSAADRGPYVSFGAGMNIVNDREVAGGGTAKFNPGFRVNVAGGYHFTPMISAELETGYLFNDVKDAGDTSLSEVPFLANVMFRFENSSAFIPFVGVGVGGVAGFFTIDDIISKDEGSDVVFAWQLQAGVHYRITDNMSAGLTYKYLGADSPEFDIGGGIIRFDVVHNHSIMASFNWSF